MATVSAALEQRVVLNNVSWETYEKLLEDLVDSSAPRLTFDRGTLEIMSPTFEHERFNRLLASFVEEAAEESDVEVENAGSTTFRRVDLDRGFEPDSCFYISNAECVLGKRTVNLPHDPPPDLVIEIDITSLSVAKLPIYARVGVPEVWRYDGDTLEIHKLERGEYVRVEHSVSFPKLNAESLSKLLEKSKNASRQEVIGAFREWLHTR
ncbi:MAG: Uma2 family endonuclease [Acidobacteriota bacterium]|nr:MAG: Uma2 family endonuclease [Acidobacteriota bacterium]